MTDQTPNHTATDALIEIVMLVKNRIDWTTDSIGGNYAMPGETHDDVAARNEVPLDALSDLVKDVLELAAPHVEAFRERHTGLAYSDGRPVQSTVGEEGWLYTHLWPADPTRARESRTESDYYGERRIVHVVPPSGMFLEKVTVPEGYNPSLTVVRDD